MTEKGIYFAKPDFYKLIKEIGGTWNDKKERPIVCLIKSTEHEELYWTLPVGNWKHRYEKAQQRILSKFRQNTPPLSEFYEHRWGRVH